MFYLKILNKAKLNYSIYNKKILAVVLGLKK